MQPSRSAAVIGCALGLGAAVTGCGTDAVGVDACRRIEQARCELVLGCPGSGVEDPQDVEDCQLYYRDQCLFGVADGVSPEGWMVEACITALGQARRCWDEGLTLAACQELAADGGATAPATRAGVDPNETGCGALFAPDVLEACSFLQPAEEPPSDAG